MKKILIASTNPGKITEIKIGLQELEKQGIKILTLNDVIVGDKEPDETGKTFQENALIKAKFYAEQTHIPVISDDGGLVIPYLNNEPGVKSRRWLGYEASDQELVDHTLKKLKNIPKLNRKAHLEACLCFYDPQTNEVIYETEKIIGHISEVSVLKIIPGFPYRALLIVEKFNKYYDELTDKEHQQINHRLIALKRLTKRIKDLI
ncbi:MAG: non-canonical purine NTP pyrophosphatase, RdgB/HAM1 family [uncultured bacterium]|nr:MAG: non-canonical purine NTP pyrophosphatase, RdgB/HAM1 family [uncultured bacterium]